MSRKKMNWFGFNLSQKQAVSIFILSIAGLFITVFLLMTMLLPLMMNIFYYDPYYDPYYEPDNYYMMIMLFTMLPYMFVFCGVFAICLYSLIRCRKIAKYYSPSIDPVIDQKPKSTYTEVPPRSTAQFCSNCGEMKKSHERFCTNCGHQAEY